MMELWVTEMITTVGSFFTNAITFFWYMVAGWFGVTLP